MPIYEFVCEDCGHPFEELLLRASAIEDVRCPDCESASIKKKLSLFASSSNNVAASAPVKCTTST
ncbi:MAG: zinc ribbon domain-containing protein [Anaerolineales bacterium]|jgi:putative FmdB family regulatory protein